DRSKRPLMGRTAESLCDVTVVTQNSQAADEMKSGIKGREEDNAMSDLIHGVEFPENIVKCQNRREAIVWALSNADADDTVLIISSDNAIQNTGNNRIADRQFVRQWLYENQPCVDTFWD
ncbi:MAG: hypothetical protein IKW74_04310, partial [Thermoguttaceae bacterium]|nr:hypothetical protein [Thermoguttaceae bacterium]